MDMKESRDWQKYLGISYTTEHICKRLLIHMTWGEVRQVDVWKYTAVLKNITCQLSALLGVKSWGNRDILIFQHRHIQYVKCFPWIAAVLKWSPGLWRLLSFTFLCLSLLGTAKSLLSLKQLQLLSAPHSAGRWSSLPTAPHSPPPTAQRPFTQGFCSVNVSDLKFSERDCLAVSGPVSL